MWFEALMGFREEHPDQVRENIAIHGNILHSKVNSKAYVFGTLETPSLGELRNQILALPASKGKIIIREIIGDVQTLHSDLSNANALFQVASQFNLLEMISPEVTPEQGIGHYEYDLTQGPACAVAAGAGTIYRNYFANVNGQIGQTEQHQIDCLSGIGDILNTNQKHWKMVNGYALVTEEGLRAINTKLSQSTEAEIDEIKKHLRIGIQWNTEVTITTTRTTVTQAYCSALPIAYCEHDSILWEAFAQLILDAAYEATLCAGILNSYKYGNNKVYLTLLGGGAFGNENEWIINAIRRALKRYTNYNLDIAFVSYSQSNIDIQQLVSEYME